MKKNNFYSVVKFTILQSMKSRWFYLMLVCGLLSVGLGVNADKIMSYFNDSKIANVGVVDLTDELFYANQIELMSNSNLLESNYKQISFADIQKSKEQIASGSGDIDAMIVFYDGFQESEIFYGENIESRTVSYELTTTSSQLTSAYRAQTLGLSEEEIASLFGIPTVTSVFLSNDETASGYLLLIMFVMMLYFLILIYGSILSNSVVEEKSSRIMETLLCYTKPLTLMLGKITGYFAIALLHMGIWGGFAFIAMNGTPIDEETTSLFAGLLTTKTIFLFAISLIFGFLMYASAYVAFASYADNAQDATQLMMPMTLLLMAAFIVSMFALNNTTSNLCTVLSYCPFFAPILFFGQAVSNGASMFSMVTHIVTQIVETAIIIAVSAYFYRQGVFHYGASNFLQRFIRVRR